MEREKKKLKDGLVSISRHRQHLEVSIGVFDQPAGMVRQPEVLLFAPFSLLRKHVEDNFVDLLLRIGVRDAHTLRSIAAARQRAMRRPVLQRSITV